MMHDIHKSLLLLYKRPRLRLFLYVITILIFVIYLYYISDSISTYNYTKMVNPESIQRFIQGAGAWSWLAYLCIVTFMVMGPLPSSIVVVIGGYLFHPILVIALTALGEALGATGNFIIGRKIGRNILMEYVPKIKKLVRKYGYYINKKTIFFLSIFPVGTSNITGYLSGMSGILFKDYITSWIFGVTCLNIVLAFLGHSAKIENYTLTVVIIIIGIGIIMLLRKYLKKNQGVQI